VGGDEIVNPCQAKQQRGATRSANRATPRDLATRLKRDHPEVAARLAMTRPSSLRTETLTEIARLTFLTTVIAHERPTSRAARSVGLHLKLTQPLLKSSLFHPYLVAQYDGLYEASRGIRP
jgi:hypothetical protein